MEALEDPGVSNKYRGPVIEALEDPNQGSEVHSSNGYKKTISFRCRGENNDSEIVSSIETQFFEKAARA